MDNEIEAIKDGAREFLLVEGDLLRGACTRLSGVAKMTTRARVHGSNEHEISGVGAAISGTSDGDLAAFEWLSEGFDDISREFGEFIKEENAFMSKGNFSW